MAIRYTHLNYIVKSRSIARHKNVCFVCVERRKDIVDILIAAPWFPTPDSGANTQSIENNLPNNFCCNQNTRWSSVESNDFIWNESSSWFRANFDLFVEIELFLTFIE